MTDDRFDDYVDEESVTDFVAEDLDTGSEDERGTEDAPGTEDGPGTEAAPDLEPDFEPDSGVDSEIAVPAPAAWTRPASTGVASVDAAIEELSRLDELPTSEHVAVYEGLHRQLQDALADLDGS